MLQGKVKIATSTFALLLLTLFSSLTSFNNGLNLTSTSKNSTLVDSQLQSAQSQAIQITATIKSLNTRISQLSESYDFNQVKLVQLRENRQALQSRVASTKKRVRSIQKQLAQEAITAFTQSGSSTLLLNLLSGSTTELVVGEAYLKNATQAQNALQNALTADNRALSRESQQLRGVEQKTIATLSNLNQLKQQANSDLTAEQNQLSQVNATVQALVLKDQQAAQQAQLALAQKLSQKLANTQASSPPVIQTSPPPAAPTTTTSTTSAVPSTTEPIPSTTTSETPTTLAYPPPNTTNSSALPQSTLNQVVQVAEAQIGKAYSFGAAGPDSFDCSGLVTYSYAKLGISLPHNALLQYDATTRISFSQLVPGDLVFYEPNTNYIEHVAIYIGNNQVVEADNYGIPVEIDPITFVGMPVAYGQVPASS